MPTQDQTRYRIVISMEDDQIHTPESPFCRDATCPCHESPDLLEIVAQQVVDGLLMPAEATRLVTGRQV